MFYHNQQPQLCFLGLPSENKTQLCLQLWRCIRWHSFCFYLGKLYDSNSASPQWFWAEWETIKECQSSFYYSVTVNDTTVKVSPCYCKQRKFHLQFGELIFERFVFGVRWDLTKSDQKENAQRWSVSGSFYDTHRTVCCKPHGRSFKLIRLLQNKRKFCSSIFLWKLGCSLWKCLKCV